MSVSNDWWNDPPEEPEIPECCNEIMSEADDHLFCRKCGHRIPYQRDDPGPEDFDCVEPEEAYAPPLCPHGNEWGDCAACDHQADIAFDAAREQRMFRR